MNVDKMRKKVLLVTGGSGEIGTAIAIKAADLHYSVCLSYLSHKDRAEEVVLKIKDTGGQSIALRADTSSEKDVRTLFELCENELGPVTHLVNNAGIVGSS